MEVLCLLTQVNFWLSYTRLERLRICLQDPQAWAFPCVPTWTQRFRLPSR